MNTTQHKTVTFIAIICFALMLVNVALAYTNAAARNEVAQRAQFVQQSIQLEGLYKEIARALAELGARNNDADVKALLQRHGITYNVNPPAAPAQPAPRK
jgi:hypothetical protein